MAQPRVILGLMTFGPPGYDMARVTDLDEYKRILDLFQSFGHKEIDTARVYIYGKQEAFTREAGWKERGLSVATKVYPTEPGMHHADILTEKFNTSLEELGTDCVDIAYLHAPDRSVPFVETLEAMDKLYKQGKFKRLGLSNYTSFEVAEIVMTCVSHGWVRPTIYQAMYNCLLRSIEVELIPACQRYGLDVVIYNPIAGGLLSGKIQTKDVVPTEGRFTASAYRARYFREGTFKALQALRETADKHGISMIEIALRWLVHHSKLDVFGTKSQHGRRDGIIVGTSSYDHLESNLKDLKKGPLPEDILAVLDEAWLSAKVDTPPYWHLDLKYTYDTQEVLFGKM